MRDTAQPRTAGPAVDLRAALRTALRSASSVRHLLPSSVALVIFAVAGCGSNGAAPASTPTVTVTAPAVTPTGDPSPSVDCSRPDLGQAGYTACVQAGHTPPAPVQPSSTPYDTAGSVTTADGRFVTYPNGRTIRFLGIQKLTAAQAGADSGVTPPPGDVLAVHLRLEQTGQPTEVGAWGPDLLYGPNQQSAGAWLFADKQFETDLPRRVSPGNPVDVWISYLVPPGQSKTLALEVPGGIADTYTPFDFLDVQTALGAG